MGVDIISTVIDDEAELIAELTSRRDDVTSPLEDVSITDEDVVGWIAVDMSSMKGINKDSPDPASTDDGPITRLEEVGWMGVDIISTVIDEEAELITELTSRRDDVTSALDDVSITDEDVVGWIVVDMSSIKGINKDSPDPASTDDGSITRLEEVGWMGVDIISTVIDDEAELIAELTSRRDVTSPLEDVSITDEEVIGWIAVDMSSMKGINKDSPDPASTDDGSITRLEEVGCMGVDIISTMIDEEGELIAELTSRRNDVTSPLDDVSITDEDVVGWIEVDMSSMKGINKDSPDPASIDDGSITRLEEVGWMGVDIISTVIDEEGELITEPISRRDDVTSPLEDVSITNEEVVSWIAADMSSMKGINKDSPDPASTDDGSITRLEEVGWMGVDIISTVIDEEGEVIAELTSRRDDVTSPLDDVSITDEDVVGWIAVDMSSMKGINKDSPDPASIDDGSITRLEEVGWMGVDIISTIIDEEAKLIAELTSRRNDVTSPLDDVSITNEEVVSWIAVDMSSMKGINKDSPDPASTDDGSITRLEEVGWMGVDIISTVIDEEGELIVELTSRRDDVTSPLEDVSITDEDVVGWIEVDMSSMKGINKDSPDPASTDDGSITRLEEVGRMGVDIISTMIDEEAELITELTSRRDDVTSPLEDVSITNEEVVSWIAADMSFMKGINKDSPDPASTDDGSITRLEEVGWMGVDIISTVIDEEGELIAELTSRRDDVTSPLDDVSITDEDVVGWIAVDMSSMKGINKDSPDPASTDDGSITRLEEVGWMGVDIISTVIDEEGELIVELTSRRDDVTSPLDDVSITDEDVVGWIEVDMSSMKGVNKDSPDPASTDDGSITRLEEVGRMGVDIISTVIDEEAELITELTSRRDDVTSPLEDVSITNEEVVSWIAADMSFIKGINKDSPDPASTDDGSITRLEEVGWMGVDIISTVIDEEGELIAELTSRRDDVTSPLDDVSITDEDVVGWIAVDMSSMKGINKDSPDPASIDDGSITRLEEVGWMGVDIISTVIDEEGEVITEPTSRRDDVTSPLDDVSITDVDVVGWIAVDMSSMKGINKDSPDPASIDDGSITRLEEVGWMGVDIISTVIDEEGEVITEPTSRRDDVTSPLDDVSITDEDVVGWIAVDMSSMKGINKDSPDPASTDDGSITRLEEVGWMGVDIISTIIDEEAELITELTSRRDDVTSPLEDVSITNEEVVSWIAADMSSMKGINKDSPDLASTDDGSITRLEEVGWMGVDIISTMIDEEGEVIAELTSRRDDVTSPLDVSITDEDVVGWIAFDMSSMKGINKDSPDPASTDDGSITRLEEVGWMGVDIISTVIDEEGELIAELTSRRDDVTSPLDDVSITNEEVVSWIAADMSSMKGINKDSPDPASTDDGSITRLEEVGWMGVHIISTVIDEEGEVIAELTSRRDDVTSALEDVSITDEDVIGWIAIDIISTMIDEEGGVIAELTSRRNDVTSPLEDVSITDEDVVGWIAIDIISTMIDEEGKVISKLTSRRDDVTSPL